jgi:hypothetical protein
MNKILFCLGLLASTTASAQTLNPTFNLDLQARIDYQRDDIDGTAIDDNSGFKGKYLNFQLSGDITPKLSYAWRQRLNKASNESSFFEATDWVYLEYRPTDRWALAAGKQVVAIGGYEYDRAPINIYRGSEFWNNIPCYQLGASATYKFKNEQDKLLAQICTNPFYKQIDGNTNTYAYNLMWMGSHGFFNTLYTLNLIEYMPKHYISYIALGHNLKFSRKVSLELDLMNRAASGQTFLFRDASVMANLCVDVTRKLQVFAKGTYDVNRTHSTADFTVLPGSEIKMAGGGVEYRPLKDKRNELRLHAFCFYSWGTNTNPDATLHNKQTFADVGVTWYMNVLRAKH